MGHKVFIGVGHGGKDSGATGNGMREKEINLSIALYLRDELSRHGVSTALSRTRDEDDPTTEEVRECNAYDPELAVDIHTNAGGGIGWEAIHTIGGGKGRMLALNIEKEIVAMGQKSRGLKTRRNGAGKDYFGFIRNTTCPAVILECAFIDSKADAAKIDTEAERKAFATAYAKGILKTLGITYKPAADPGQDLNHWAYIVQTKFLLSNDTMVYLRGYRYAYDLMKRLAITTGTGSGATAEERVRTKYHFADDTMAYLKRYRYSADLLRKLAAG